MAEYGLMGYRPKLPDGYAIPDDAGVVFGFNVAGMKRPKFHRTIRDALEQAVEKQIGCDPQNNKLLFYRCGSCGTWGEGQSMHMGHKVNWKDYLTSKKPNSEQAGILAYNDLRNLHFEHGVCNTSHAFENGALSDADEALEKFEELSTRYVIASVPLGIELELSSGYKLLLAAPTVGHRSKKAFGEGVPRPKWDKSTRTGLIAIWKGAGWIQQGMTPSGRTVDLYRCGSCRNWGEGFSMQLGHIEKWGSYLTNTAGLGKTKSATVADAQWAYNDLNNLMFEHPTCNSGHEWEEHSSDDPEFTPDPALKAEIEAYIASATEDRHAIYEEIAGAEDVDWSQFAQSDDVTQHFDRTTGRLIATAILIELEAAGEASLFDNVNGSIPRSQVTGSTGDHFSSEPVRKAYIKSETMKSELVGLVVSALKMNRSEIRLSPKLLEAMSKIKDPSRGLPTKIANQFHLEVDRLANFRVGRDEICAILGPNNAHNLDTRITEIDASTDAQTQDFCDHYTRKVTEPVVVRFNETWQGLIGTALTMQDLENFKRALEMPADTFESLTLCGVELEPQTIKLSCAGFVKLAASANGVSAAELGLAWITSLPLLRK